MWFVRLLLVVVFTTTANAKSLSGADAKGSACSYENDAISLSWSYDDVSTDVVFKISTRSEQKNFWTGVFFGDEQPEDALGVFVRNGQIGVMDGHVAGDRLHMDNLTNVQSLHFDLQDDVLTAELARASFTNDLKDADLSNCITFFFPLEVIQLDKDGRVQLPERMETRRICDITVTCSNRDRPSELVKRSDASICEHTQGKSTVSWKAVGDTVEFLVGQNAEKGRWWTAVGVGHGMEDLKMAIAFMENGVTKFIGGYQTQGYGVPRADASVKPSINPKTSRVSNGRSFVQFSLPMSVFDLYSDDGGCVTLQISVLGGRWTGKFDVKKHDKTPEAVVVCGIEHCRDVKTVNQKAEVRIRSTTENPEAEVEKQTENPLQKSPETDPVTEEEGLLKKEDSAREIDETVREVPLGVRQTLQSVDPDSSGIEPALNDTSSIFASAAQAIDSIPEGSGSIDVGSGDIGSGDASGASGETATVESVQDNELTSSGTLAAEGALKLTTVDGEAHRTSPLPTSNASLPDVAPTPATAPVIDSIPQTAEAEASEVPLPTTNLSSTASVASTTTTEALNVTVTSSTTGRPLVLSRTVAPAVAKILKNGCTEGHTDLQVCERYFADYLAKVKEWANKHNQLVGEQMWKACTLLSQVKHVPTMCCTVFRATCATHLQTSV